MKDCAGCASIIGLVHRCSAFEGDDALGPELDKQDDEQDHIGLSSERVGWVKPLDPLLQEADQCGACKCAPDIANTTDHNGHETLDDIVRPHL